VNTSLDQFPILNSRFHQSSHYRSQDDAGYACLPFRFIALDDSRYVATNLVGEYAILSQTQIRNLISGTLPRDDVAYDSLRSRHFLLESNGDVALDLLAAKYRTSKSHLDNFTGLHIFVVSLRCEHSCPYCQVSRVTTDKDTFDMSMETAEKSIDLMFRSPSPALKVEFQGGEPLLNFPLIQQIVSVVNERNQSEGRDIQFVIATNLALLTDEIIEFCGKHNVCFSTSLDGPADIHNSNRPRPGGDSYERTVDGIKRIRNRLGPNAVAALMTTTLTSLNCPEAIIDEYIRQGFTSIFLRWLSPYGFAARTSNKIGYASDSFMDFYEKGLRYILKINENGFHFCEEYAALVLRKILTPFSTGYVDLQSPAGLGISAVVYNYDGDVYASDEARMLAESGDTSFRLGNVHEDSFEKLFLSEDLIDLLLNTMTESTPQCSECAFEPYCGTDPVFHHAVQGDPIGHRPTSDFCARNMHVFRLLIRLLEDNENARRVMESWIAS